MFIDKTKIQQCTMAQLHLKPPEDLILMTGPDRNDIPVIWIVLGLSADNEQMS